jgi:hypothetical protein
MKAERVKEGLDFVFGYASHITEWVTLKKELLKFFNPFERQYFSTRDPVTKKQGLNEFEKAVIFLWENMTDRKMNT